MLKLFSNGMKKVLAISFAVLFVVSLTAIAASAHEGRGHGGYGGWGPGWGGCGYGCGYPYALVPYCGYLWNPYTNMFVWTC